jgi:outer membrane receptor protein involved in Fe transport
MAWIPDCLSLSARGLAAALLFAVVALGAPGRASAQTSDTSTLRGRVVDQTGAAIVGATVTAANEATGLRRAAQTDGAGYYALAGLPLTGRYTLTAEMTGFAPHDVKDIELRAGEAPTVDVTLDPSGGSSEVTVYGTAGGVQSDSPQLGTRLDQRKIEETPILGRKLTNLPFLNSAVRPARGTGDLFLNNTLFVINGNGRRQTTFTIDGSTGDDAWGRQTIFTNIPFAAVQEFTVLTNAFSAEYGRTTGSAVNVVTKSGTNDFHGEGLFLWRPSGIQARAPYATRRTADELAQASGVFSGPIATDRTHFLVSAEFNNQDRDSVITSPLERGLYRGTFRQGLLLARVDHQIDDANTLTGKFGFDLFHDTNPSDAVGGLNLPGTARVFRRRTYTGQVSETAILSDRLVNEAHFQMQFGQPITEFEPVTPSPQIVATGIYVSGESRASLLTNNQFELADTMTLALGGHNLRFGAQVLYSSSGGDGQEFGSGFTQGQFTVKPGIVKPVDEVTIADIGAFTQSFGSQQYRVHDWMTGVFVQDSWRVRPDLTLNLGLRYENQTFTDDDNNFAPRVGFAWNPGGHSSTVVRGSYGVFYSEIRANLAAGYEINGPEGLFSFSAVPGGLGFPTSIAPLPAFPAGAVLPPRNITVRPGQREYLGQFFDVSKLAYPDKLLNPYTQQATVGVEYEIAPNWIVSADYIHQRTIGIDRAVDLNAPSAFVRTAPGQIRAVPDADATRPIRPVPGGFRQILSTVNNGTSEYDGLQLNLNKRFSARFSMLLSYTLSKTENTAEPDAPGSQVPNDYNLLGPEYELAPSLLDQRHRAALSGWYDLPWEFSVGAFAQLASGRPFNSTTGVDNNGDFSRSDRPVVDGVVLARNAFRGDPVYDVSTFVEKRFELGEDMVLSLRAEAFNVFNHPNVVGYNSTYGDLSKPLASFAAPLGGIANVDPGRQFQFMARFRF